MNIFALPNLVVSIYTLALGIIVLHANPRNGTNQVFFVLSLNTFAWLFSYGLLYNSNNAHTALIFARLGHSASVLIVPVVYGFMLTILGSYRKEIDRWLAIISAIMAVFAVLLTFTSKLYFIDIVKRFWGYYPIGGPLMHAYIAWTFFMGVRAIYLLNDASKRAAKDLYMDAFAKFKYHALSLSIFILSAIDFLPKFGIVFYPFGYVFVGASSSLITFAIVKHSLHDVRIIINRSFVYSVLVAIITSIYLAFILLSEYFFRSYFGYASIITAILISSIIAVTFNPIRTKVQKFVDKQFYLIDPERLATENAKLKEVIQNQDKMKAVATLAAGMAHEIKNPLTSIKTFAEYLPKKYDDPEFRSKFSRLIVDEVDRINNIVKQLLDFSKPSEPELKSVVIADLLEETLGLLNNNLLKHRITLHKELDAYAILKGDKHQLKQALLNLFLNSIQSMPNGGCLNVLARREHDGYVHVTISDTGTGINEEHLPHVFDPFYTTKDGGTGLGLAIVHSIISKHGGKIDMKSTVGVGTSVNVALKSQS